MKTLTPEFEAEVRRAINPDYADKRGTASYARAMLLGEIDRLRAKLKRRCEDGTAMIQEMTAYRVEVETTNFTASTTKTLDGQQYVNCQGGVLTVVTSDPSIIMKTFNVKKVEKIGPGYIL